MYDFVLSYVVLRRLDVVSQAITSLRVLVFD